MTDTSGAARYDRHARLEVALKRVIGFGTPRLSFHRRLRSLGLSRRPRDGLYELIDFSVGNFRGQRILDAGCGFGGLVAWARIHRNVRVEGITMSRVQAQLARKHLPKYRASPLDIRMGDYNQLPRNSYDVVVAVESLIHSSDLTRSLSSMLGSLRNEGSLVVVDDFWQHQDPALANELNRLGWGIARGLVMDDLLRAASRLGARRTLIADLTSHVQLEPAWLTRLMVRLLRLLPLQAGSFLDSRRNFYLALFLQNIQIHLGRTRYLLLRLDKD